MNEAAIVVREPKESFKAELVELERTAPSTAVTLRAAFEQMFDDAEEWAKRAAAIRVTSVEQTREMRLARETRLALREIRVNAEKKRKMLKENIVREGKAIDGLCNILKALVEPLEEKLLIDEKFAERVEEERKRNLAAERAEMLVAYGADPLQFVNLGEMSDETWASTKETARLAKEAREAEAKKQEEIRLEAERIAAERAESERKEAARLEAERVAREQAQREENERLRKEAEQRELEAQAEREKHAAEMKAKEEAAAAERKKADEERAAAAERERQATEAKKKAELDAQAARETLARADREANERLEREKKEREAAELAPDKEKLVALASGLRKFPWPKFTTAKGQAAAKKAADNFEKLAAWLEKTAGEL